MNAFTTTVDVNYASAHFNHRKFDGVFEIIARATIGADGPFHGEEKYITIATAPNRVKAVEAVREFRAMAPKRAA